MTSALALAVLSVAAKDRLEPSSTVASLMVRVAAALSLSVMVAVPVTPLPLVTVPVIAPVDSVKVSEDSARLSSVVASRNWTELWPAAMVTAPETVLQLAPPLVETCSRLAAAVSVPSVAVPLLSVGVKLTAEVEVLFRETVKTALAPSFTVTSPMLMVGVSLLVPPLPVPSSLMVPTPWASEILALVALARLTLKDSEPSKTLSLLMVTEMTWEVSPAAKFRVPAVAE